MPGPTKGRSNSTANGSAPDSQKQRGRKAPSTSGSRRTHLKQAALILGGLAVLAGTLNFLVLTPGRSDSSTNAAASSSSSDSTVSTSKVSSSDDPQQQDQQQEQGTTAKPHQPHVEPPIVVGNTTLMPPFGIYPKGCKWREVHTAGTKHVGYHYWDDSAQDWTDRQPAACRLQSIPKPGPPDWAFHSDTPRTEVVPSTAHVLYRNLWYNGGRWYALVDGDAHVAAFKFSRNVEINTLHVRDATAFADATAWRLVRGDSLLFDFIYFLHPTAIGHWWEMMGPLFSVLRTLGSGFARPCDNFLLLHLKRAHLMEWVRGVMAVALGGDAGGALPLVALQQDKEVSPFEQLLLPLEGVGVDEWLVFERVMVVRDLYTGGKRTFQTQADAQQFRALMYQQYGLPAPKRRPRVPRTITFQRKRANRRVINEEAMLKLLGTYGEVNVVEFNASTSLKEQLMVMRNTGVFVSVHTSNLANSLFLQPGSAVIEIIQQHWHWNRLDESFRDQTAVMGDIHHYAWRANHNNETVFIQPRDVVRFDNWTKAECMTEDCVEAHTNVDVVVDLVALKALLDGRLPLVFAGASKAEAELPWPPAL